MWIDQLPQCAPTVHPYTMEQVVRVESAGNPLAVHVNGLAADRQPKPVTTAEAVAAARHWIALGYRVDLGMMQITDRNLPVLHLTVEQGPRLRSRHRLRQPGRRCAHPDRRLRLGHAAV